MIISVRMQDYTFCMIPAIAHCTILSKATYNLFTDYKALDNKSKLLVMPSNNQLKIDNLNNNM